MAFQAVAPRPLGAERRFYLAMTTAIWASVLLGFSRSFFLRPMFPAAHAPPEPYFYVHGAVFTCWLALLTAQVGLVSMRDTAAHRRLGVAGFYLVPLMTLLGVFGALLAAHRPGGFIDVPEPPLRFLTVPLANIVWFAGLAGLGLLLRRDPQTHKRLMLMGTIVLVEAAIVRWPFELMATSGDFDFFLSCAFVLPLIAWDLSTRRSLHPATLWGGLAMLAQMPARDLLAKTDAWMGFATWAEKLFA